MSHSSQHQYDDPNFSIIVEVSAAEAAAGYKWTIVNEMYQSNQQAGKQYGVSETGDPADMSGSLALNGQAGLNVGYNLSGTELLLEEVPPVRIRLKSTCLTLPTRSIMPSLS